MTLYALKHKGSGLWAGNISEFSNLFAEEDEEVEFSLSESLVPMLAYCPKDLDFEGVVNRWEFDVVKVKVVETQEPVEPREYCQ